MLSQPCPSLARDIWPNLSLDAAARELALILFMGELPPLPTAHLTDGRTPQHGWERADPDSKGLGD